NVRPADADRLPLLVAVGAEAGIVVLRSVLRHPLGGAAAWLYAKHLDRDRRRIRVPDLALEAMGARACAGDSGDRIPRGARVDADTRPVDYQLQRQRGAAGDV